MQENHQTQNESNESGNGLIPKESSKQIPKLTPNESKPSPNAFKKAWSVSRALASFVMNGMRTTTREEYVARLEICEPCDQRDNNHCAQCGCSLAFKASGRTFQCPLKKWPELN